VHTGLELWILKSMVKVKQNWVAWQIWCGGWGNSKFLPNSWKHVFSYGRKFKPMSQWVTHLIIQER
jgi:hypothetical protein